MEVTDTEVKAELAINAWHRIFEGHFPGQPVVPGVCMMEMVKEILEQVTGKKTNLVKAQEMKFLAVIDPARNNLISADIKYTAGEDGSINVIASFFKEELIHFRFKGSFTTR
ncbi:MAG: 3-hydroxyacyl-ACP dehydratase [Chitinophagaceae bacterium]|nr:3-hydroxyacyl-ACP dehydratase [Chitinophagaceae bacterium]